MVQRIPPPPPIASADPVFNRWLLELSSILASSGGVDTTQIPGYGTLQSQVATNTSNITALQGTTTGQGSQLTVINLQISVINGEITTINSQLTTLGARAQVLNGAGNPAAGLGNNNDWYLNTTGGAGSKIWLKLGGTWTAYL